MSLRPDAHVLRQDRRSSKEHLELQSMKDDCVTIKSTLFLLHFMVSNREIMQINISVMHSKFNSAVKQL